LFLNLSLVQALPQLPELALLAQLQRCSSRNFLLQPAALLSSQLSPLLSQLQVKMMMKQTHLM
jgi:hypothetical protein